MLQPKRTKFRKQHKGRNRGLAQRGSTVSFGEYALKATGRGRMTARQIEAARRAMTRRVKRGGQIWIRVFPDKPITQKPLEVRQGKGKGNSEKSNLKKSKVKVKATLSIGLLRLSLGRCSTKWKAYPKKSRETRFV